MKLSCSRCVLTLQKCVYPLAPCIADVQQGKLCLQKPLFSVFSVSNGTTYTHRLPSLEATTSPNVTMVERNKCVDFEDLSRQLSDTNLYHHYVQHTSRTLTYCQKDHAALQIGMPTLALRSKPVFQSLLALSATCLCCDMIAKEEYLDTIAVSQVLTTAHRHYNSASEQMRKLMSKTEDFRPEPILASTILLVPFAAASQQIHHWISSKFRTKSSRKILSTTPRDVIIMMRGVRTILQALKFDDLSSNIDIPQQTDCAVDNSWLLESNHLPSTPPGPPSSHTHVLFAILADTSQRYFSNLQE